MQIHDISEYVTWHIPPPEYYIQDILPKQGVMLVYGSPKVKKSWFVEQMGFCVSTGSDFLGFTTTQARTFVANFEISPIEYHRRLFKMSRHFEVQPQMFYEGTQMLMYLDEPEQFNRFRVLCREIQPKVIILDCLAMCFGGDENNGQHMASFIEKLSELKAEFEASIILVHHTNKNMLAGSSVDRARGHSRLTGWVDTLLYMAEQPNGVQLQFKARQSARDLHNINIVFQPNEIWTPR